MEGRVFGVGDVAVAARPQVVGRDDLPAGEHVDLLPDDPDVDAETGEL